MSYARRTLLDLTMGLGETLLTSELVEQRTLGEPAPLVAELVHAREKEWAETLGDVLQRRCMAGLRAGFGLDEAAAAARWLHRLGIWDASRAAEELQAYRELARRQNAATAAA